MPRFTRSVLTVALALATFGTLGTAQAADVEVYGRLDTGFLYPTGRKTSPFMGRI